MPEEPQVDSENKNEGEAEEEMPSDLLPLFFTSKTQEIFGCKGDEDVTEESPHKLIPKEAILKDFKDRAAISDFHPAKQIVLDYPDEELLVVYDAAFKYGQNFYLCTTEEAKERTLNPPVPEEELEGEVVEEEVVIVVRRGLATPKPWISLGSEVDVVDENVSENRKRVKFRISRKRREFGAPVFFSDRNVADIKDGFIECPSYEDDNDLRKRELDKSIQTVAEVADADSQTEWRKPKNAVVQCVPRMLPEDDLKKISESKPIEEFVNGVAPRFEIALQQNEIMDVFYDDYMSLADEDSTFGSKSDNYLKEYQSFTDLQFSKEKNITEIQWHPTIKGIIAVSCGERLSFDDRVEMSSRILMTPSLILLWSFSDPIHPQLILEAPDDIFTFKFNPSEPGIIAGGCINGQIVLWDISAFNDRLKNLRQAQSQPRKNPMNSLPGFEDGSNFDRSPIVRYCAVSSIESSHKTSILDLQWIPDHMEIGRMGVILENKSLHCSQIITSGPDGSIMFWDTRPNKSAPAGSQDVEDHSGIPTTFKHLDLTWKPILKASVTQLTGTGEFGPTRFSIAERQGDRGNVKADDKTKESVSSSTVNRMTTNVLGKKDQAKTLENVTSKFFVGTEEGDLVYVDWKPEKDTDTGKIITPRPEIIFNAHEGPINVLQRSPFYKDIILSVGGWTFAIWKEGESSGPLLQSASHVSRLTSGRWSPSRPGVFFITRSDGNVDVWDLLDKSHEPSLTQNVTSVSITSIYPRQVSSKQQLVAVGDSVGTLHIMEVPWNLRHPSPNETAVVENYFEREVKRLAFVGERQKIRADEKKAKDAQMQIAHQEVKRLEDIEADWQAKAKIEYQEYLEMEKKILLDIGVLEEEEEVLDM